MTLRVRSVAAGVREGAGPVARILSDAAPGWTPVLAAEADGERVVVKVADWVGGAGSKPSTGYVGDAATPGLRPDRGDGFNFNRATETP